MKAILKSTTITAIFALIFTLGTMANVTIEEETYIDDIPFDTEAVYSRVVIERNLVDIDFDDEAYINDIPFNTDKVAEYELYELALEEEFTFAEENYIDDIPFKTEEVCETVNQAPNSNIFTCENSETATIEMNEEEIELKYFEQNNHILVHY